MSLSNLSNWARKKEQMVKTRVEITKKRSMLNSFKGILIFQSTSKLSAPTCICAGYTCGVALCGSKIKRNSCLEQTNYSKWLASWKQKVDVFLTRTSLCLSFKRATDMECSRWLSACMNRCVHAESLPLTPFSQYFSTIRKRIYVRRETRTQTDTMHRFKSVSIKETGKYLQTQSRQSIESTCFTEKKNSS